jgi:hypothetical protein
MPENERLLTINEWLDTIGCDRAYRKDMKDTYNKALVELKAQDLKTRSQTAREIIKEIESLFDSNDYLTIEQFREAVIYTIKSRYQEGK